MFRGLLQSLRGGFGRATQASASAPADRALLDEAQLQALALFARTLPDALLEFQRPSDHPLIGETPSFHRGRGFEFEENRRYQAGDEPRLLNWRLYARSGELYTKVFTEERRPELFLLVDRRAAMRFGTRRQLKVAQAARVAACYAALARHHSLAVGGLILNRRTEWYAPRAGDVLQLPLVHALTAPAPPLDLEGEQPGIEQGLQHLLHDLPAGCLVLLVSDFSDLDPDTGRTLLQPLAARHTVRAVQILDPAETKLPAGGEFLIEDGLIEDAGAPEPIRIDGGDTRQQSLYSERFRAQQMRLEACFRDCGIPLRTCSTEDHLETCLGLSDAEAAG